MDDRLDVVPPASLPSGFVTQSPPPARAALGRMVLVLSGAGFPLTQALITRWGSRGAVVSEGVITGLIVRDVALVRGGAPARLKALPRVLLWLELGAATAAGGLGLVAIARPSQGVERTPAGTLEAARRLAVGLLFGIHTYRFRIYLSPGRGLVDGT